MMFDETALQAFYKELSAPNGIEITDLHTRLENLFSQDRLPEDLNNRRLGHGPWKKLRDEIVPVSKFLKFKKIETGRVQFPLDNYTPDCWLLGNTGERLGIEVTIARGRERYHRTKEMIEKGIGRGFIGVQDDAPQSDFDRCMARDRIMYSSDQALDATKQGIGRCLSRKKHPRYDGIHYLLVYAKLINLPNEWWRAIQDELSRDAAGSPFQEIHVIDTTGENPRGFQIK